MVELLISNEILRYCPEFHLAYIKCNIINTFSDELLWEKISFESNRLKKTYQISDINKRENIKATREAYKSIGKDPNRYRPSAESLCRRILREMDLYRINTIVDLINLVSIRSGYSINGFDADKIQGSIVLGIGKPEEPFEAIGRGKLNIESLPVYRDLMGGIGTTTSDEERTKITIDTSHLLIIINAFSHENDLIETVEYTKDLLYEHADAENISSFFSGI